MNIILILIGVCFSLSFSLAVIFISRPRQRMAKFFEQMEFRGKGNQKIPRCIGREQVSKYLVKMRFKSTIPTDRWEKIRGDLELFYNKKICKMEQSRKDIRIMDIYFIEATLPPYIEWQDEFMEDRARFAIGEGYNGKVVWDASNLPHGLIGGATGSGKTGLLRCIIHQAIKKRWNVSVLDFKGGGDFTDVEQEAEKYRDLEDGYGPFIINDPEEAQELLLCLTVEVKGRLSTFREAGVSNIDEYNARGREQFIPWLLVVDEAAELLDVKPKNKAEKELYTEIDHYLRTLARLSPGGGSTSSHGIYPSICRCA